MNEKPSIELIKGENGPDISFNRRLLFCNQNETKKRLKTLNFCNRTLYVVFSPLLCYCIEELEEKIPSDSRLLLIEQDYNLYNISLPYFKKLILKKSKYFYLPNLKLKELFYEYTNLQIRNVKAVKLNRGYMIHRKQYENFFLKAETLIQQYWKNKITMIHMGRLWFKNIFYNLPSLNKEYSIEKLKTEKPVIVCGAGESLEFSIKTLRKYRKLFFLVAVDTAVCTLLSNKLFPDLIIILESQHANIFDFYHKDTFKLPAAFDLTSSPEVLRKFTGEKYFFASEFCETNLFKELTKFNLLPNTIPPLGSVGIAAIYISSLITNSYIFFTGIDLSFIPDKYHATGSPTHTIMLFNSKKTFSTGFFSAAWNKKRIKVKDKSGRNVYTDIVMTSYASTLQTFLCNNNRIYNIGTLGLEVGNKIDKQTLIKMLESEHNENSNNETIQTDYNNEYLLSFLKKQLSIIKESIALVIEYRNVTHSDSNLENKMLKSLSSIDYTWLFFPDTGDYPQKTESFLKRFLYSATWFKRIIINSISILEN